MIYTYVYRDFWIALVLAEFCDNLAAEIERGTNTRMRT